MRAWLFCCEYLFASFSEDLVLVPRKMYRICHRQYNFDCFQESLSLDDKQGRSVSNRLTPLRSFDIITKNMTVKIGRRPLDHE